MYIHIENPQQGLKIELKPQQMSISLESTGDVPVDIIGYVHDVDVASLAAIRKQLMDSTPKEPSFDPFDVSDYKQLGEYIRYKDVKIGPGMVPMRGQTVLLSYKLKLANGEEINSDVKADRSRLPIKRKIPVAVAKVCPGVDKALRSIYRNGT